MEVFTDGGGGLHAARMDSVGIPTMMLQSGGGSGGSDTGQGFPPHSSRNNVNVEQAGERRLVEKEAKRETEEGDRARVTDIPLTPR